MLIMRSFELLLKRVVVISYRRFRTVCWSYFQESRILDTLKVRPTSCPEKYVRNCRSKQTIFFYVDPLKMGLICCPETSVVNNHYSLRNNPESAVLSHFASEV
jgi:hypothetical protein